MNCKCCNAFVIEFLLARANGLGAYLILGIKNYGDNMAERWYVVQTIPRMEKWAVDNLIENGFQTYWPRYMVKIKNRPKAEKYRSVFSSYVFAKFDSILDPWRSICSTRGVRRILGASEEDAVPLPCGFVEMMLTDNPSGVIEAPENNAIVFKTGDQIKIVDGPLAGHVGVMKYSERGRIALLLSLLGRENIVYLAADRVTYAGAPL